MNEFATLTEGIEKIDYANEDEVNDLVRHLISLSRCIDKDAIFSANEECDDINTGDLKYLLINAYLAIALSHVRSIHSLNNSLLYLERFRNDCHRIGILVSSIENVNFTARREDKILRFKASKANEAEIRRLSNLHSTDESVERECILRTIELYSYRISELEGLIQMEIALLKIKEEGGIIDKTKSEPISNFRPFTIINRKSDSVFRPGHRLPTMTIDEYLASEQAKGNFLSSKTNMVPILSEEEERQKSISWDDFKESTPRGSGNRYNRS